MNASKKKIIIASIASSLAVVLLITTIYCANRFGWFKKGGNPAPTPTTTPTTAPVSPTPTSGLPVADGTYYEVSFASDDAKVVLPEKLMLEEGTPIYSIGTPLRETSVFTGWYTDKEMTQLLDRNAVVDKNMTLYPSFADSADAEKLGFNLNYVSSQKVADNFELYIEAYDISKEDLLKLITVKNQTKGDIDVEFILELVSERDARVQLTAEEKAILDACFNGKDFFADESKLNEESLRKELGLTDSDNLADYFLENGFSREMTELMAKVFRFDEASKANAATVYRYVLKSATGKWRAGSLHQVEIKDTKKARFVYNDETMTDAVIYHNFTVYKANIDKLTMSDDVVFIPLSETSGIDIGKGFFSVVTDENGEYITERNNMRGTFEYTGSAELHKGTTIAVYDGTLGADKRVDGKVSYFKLSAEPNGTTITYESADVEEIIPIPEVFPVADDGSFSDNTVFIKSSDLDFTKKIYEEFKFNSNTKIEAGDFLAFYKGAMDTLFEGNAIGYACVTKVEEVNGGIQVTYNEVTLDTIQHSLELYTTQDNIDMGLTAEDLEKIAKEIEENAQKSEYYNALGEEIGKLLTDENIDLSKSEYKDYYDKMVFATSDGSELSLDEVRKLASGGRVTVSKPTVQASLALKLQHFTGNGVRLELAATFQIGIDLNKTANQQNKLEITVTAVFEQEIVLGIDMDWDITWKWFVIPVDLDVSMSLRAGTFTGFGIFATVQTKAESLNKDKAWGDILNLNNATLGSGSHKAAENILGKLSDLGTNLTKLKNGLKLMNGTGVSSGADDNNGNKVDGIESVSPGTGGGLVEKYSSMLKNDSQYVRIVEQPIVQLEMSPDPFHIIDLSLDIKVFVAFKINAMVGFSISYGNAKQMSYNFCLAAQTGKQSTADLETPNFRVDFFAFGMMGIRAGVEFDARVGLISTKLDSVGVLVEVGFEFEAYGFFYVAFTWKSGDGFNSEMYGSLLFRIGWYVNVDFYAQLGDGRLGKKINLYNHRGDLLNVGTEFFPMSLEVNKNDPDLNLTVGAKNEVVVPQKIFNVKGMVVKNGNEEVRAVSKYDFTVTSNNPAFSYRAYENKIVVDTSKLPAGATSAKAELTFTYNNSTFGINSVPIEVTVKAEWNEKTIEVKYLDNETKEVIYKISRRDPLNTVEQSAIYTAIKEALNSCKEGYYLEGINYNNVIIIEAEITDFWTLFAYSTLIMNGPSEEHPYYVVFKKNTYNVNWEVDGEIVKTETLEYQTKLTAPNPTKTDYYLSDWTINGEKLTADTSVPAGDITIKANWIHVHEHSWANEYVKQAASCTETGLAEYTCSICNEKKTEVLPIDTNNHTADLFTANYVAATCQKEGYSGDDVCQGCQQIVNKGQATPKDPDNHSLTDAKIVKAASCVVKGLAEVDCEWCGQKTQMELPVDPDNHASKTVIENAVAADCSHEGYSGDEVCPDCKTVIKKGEATAKDTKKHLHETSAVTKAATCNTKGETTISCAECGAKLRTEEIAIDANNHVSKAVLENVVAADCSHEGYSGDEVCPDCKAVTKKGAVTAKNTTKHLHETSAVTKAATCNAKGETTISCADCGAKLRTEEIAIDAKNHVSKAVLKNVVTATCNTAGYSGDEICPDCNAVIKKGVATAKDASNHVSEHVIENAKAATCTTDGYTGDEACPDCHTVFKKGSVISAANAEHKWTVSAEHALEFIENDDIFGYNSIKAPYTEYVCSVCKDTKTEVQKIKPAICGTLYTSILEGWECTTVQDFEPNGFIWAAVYIGGNAFDNRHDTTEFELGTEDQIVWAEDYSNLKLSDITKDVTLKAKYIPGDTENFESFEFEVILHYGEPIYEMEGEMN